VEIKQQIVQNNLSQKRIEVENKVRNYYNQVENARKQVNLSLSIVNNTNGMLRAELRKFELGESSIFLINSREQKLFETQLKLIKTQGEFAKSVLAVYWAAGKLAGTF
jgi:outer membrane protein TolC